MTKYEKHPNGMLLIALSVMSTLIRKQLAQEVQGNSADF
jgi:hypothetical protein